MSSHSHEDIIRQTMVKKVNIIASRPVRTMYPPIYGTYEGVSMSPANILKCLLHKAHVEEVLSDGSTVVLNMNNYNKVNEPAVVPPQPKLEYRRTAVDPPTMDQLKNKTANLPPSHFLYDIKTEVDSEAPMSSEEAAALDKDRVTKEVAISTHEPARELPVAESGDTKGGTEFEKNSAEQEDKSKNKQKK